MAAEIERKLDQLVGLLEAKGRQIPRSVEEIPDLPYMTFEALCAALLRDEVRLQRFAQKPNSDLASILSNPAERFLTNVLSMSLIVIPIGSIALGYFVSWWFLLGIGLVFIALSSIKGLYNRAVLRSAFDSELCFCFLFYCNQISVVTSDFKKSYYWDTEQ